MYSGTSRYVKSGDSPRVSRLARILVSRITAAIEDKIALLSKKYEINEIAIKRLFTLDPTHGKYLEWLVLRVDRGEIPEHRSGLERVGPEIAHVLEIFVQISKSSAILKRLGANSDINTYTYETLRGLASRALASGDLESNRQKKKDTKQSGSKIIYDDGHFKIIQVGGPGVDPQQAATAACIYAWGTKWCTSKLNTSREYLEKGPLYIIFRDGEKIAQYHTMREELHGSNGESLKLGQRAEVLSLLKKAGVPLSSNDWIDLIVHKYPFTLEDLEYIKKSPRLIYNYARDYTGHPWPEAEPLLLNDLQYSVYYCISVKRTRWPELEKELLIYLREGYWRDYQDLAVQYERAFFPRQTHPEGWPELEWLFKKRLEKNS